MLTDGDEAAPEDGRELRAVCGAEEAGVRLDRFIALRFGEEKPEGPAEAGRRPGLSRNYAEQLIGQGDVTVNGQPALKKNKKLAAGDAVAVFVPEPVPADITPEDIPLDIVYEDDDVLVVNKPRGMVVHPAPGNESGTLVNAVMFHCGNSLSSINGVARPGIVHRIDKDTSGLLMIAKNDAAHESLAAQLEKHTVTREYWALCCDNLKEDTRTIDAPIGRDPRNRLRRAVNGSGAREAVTHIRVLERFGKCTLISARLETGRTHQIRVHLAYIRHPLVGDRLYGTRTQPVRLTGIPDLDLSEENVTGGQILHAKVLGFVHPGTGEYMEFDSELPPYFEAVLERCRG